MITHAPNAPLGSVVSLPEFNHTSFPAGSCILCRNNLPLLQLAFKLLRKSTPIYINGRDLATTFITLIDKSESTTIQNLRVYLEARRRKEAGRLVNLGRDPQLIDEKYACLNLFMENANSIHALKSTINALFTKPANASLTLSTIHKSKGLEWPHVFILDRSLIKFRSPDLTKSQRLAERNLYYVAVTRAKLTLTYITLDTWTPTLTVQPLQSNNPSETKSPFDETTTS